MANPQIENGYTRLANEIVITGFRSLALKYHPDQGGNHEDMVSLNRSVEWLRARMGG